MVCEPDVRKLGEANHLRAAESPDRTCKRLSKRAKLNPEALSSGKILGPKTLPRKQRQETQQAIHIFFIVSAFINTALYRVATLRPYDTLVARLDEERCLREIFTLRDSVESRCHDEGSEPKALLLASSVEWRQQLCAAHVFCAAHTPPLGRQWRSGFRRFAHLGSWSDDKRLTKRSDIHAISSLKIQREAATRDPTSRQRPTPVPVKSG